MKKFLKFVWGVFAVIGILSTAGIISLLDGKTTIDMDTLYDADADSWTKALAIGKLVASNIPHDNQDEWPKHVNAIGLWELSYPSGYTSGEILLDVLYEDISYNKVLSLPIQSPLLKTDGEPVMVQVPSLDDLLGDKLTAFAPHTTGIPFFKGEKPFSMEIMKQLFDISSILDRTDTLEVVRSTFGKIVPIELGYRGLDELSAEDVLSDAYNTAMNICLYGALDRQEYTWLTSGAHRVNGFILTENYAMERAVRDAAKVAYLARLLQLGINEVRHYTPADDAALATEVIEDQTLNKLNRLKKVNTEAFFYCRRLEELR